MTPLSPVCSWSGVVCDGGIVTRLELSGKSLSGSIAYTLWTLTALTYLDLSNNGLTGTVPTSLGKLSALQALDLSSNSLTGTFPAALCQSSSLSQLFTTATQFSCYAGCLSSVALFIAHEANTAICTDSPSASPSAPTMTPTASDLLSE